MEITTAVTPPPIQAPTAKEKKYDRQLRLWAASGQRNLEESHVLLVIGGTSGSNSSVTGAETLKNLVLPSVGSFTVADPATVAEEDLGVNFFLEADSLGKPRAAEITRLLKELNPDVTGHAISADLSKWLSSDPATTLKPYNLILLCAPVPADVFKPICLYTQQHDVPLIYIQSIGFSSYFSIQLPPFPIVDTHPDPDSTQDVRLLAPWPELSAMAKLGDLTTLSDHEHGHVPYILLLLHYLEEWKSTHDGAFPNTFKEKTQFREHVRAGIRTNNADGGEENYDEACAAVLKTINPPAIGSGCREMFQMGSCIKLGPKSANFWIIAHTIKSFYTKHSVLPLPGSLPDMKAQSADYIGLQNIYKTKARADVAEVLSSVREIEKTLGTSRPPIPEAEVEQFCKNAAHVKVLPESPLIHTRLDDPKLATRIAQSLSDPTTLTPVFLALLQSDSIDSSSLMKSVNAKLPEQNEDDEFSPAERLERAREEVQRAEFGELHNIASLTGGMVAQEAIKLITRQYVPVDNLCIYDGILCRTEVVKL